MVKVNGLTLAEEERLIILAEEMGESIQAISKILRHGNLSHSPFDKEKIPNVYNLERELGDVLCLIDLLVDSGDLFRDNIELHREKKMDNLKKYTHYQLYK